MTDEECPDFEGTIRTMLNTPPVVRARGALKPEDDPRDSSATQDGDDVVDATEEDEDE